MQSQFQGIWIKNFRSFRENFEGIDGPNLINILVGRNNSGKSAFLDALMHIQEGQKETNKRTFQPIKGLQYKVKQKLDDDSLKRGFRPGVSRGGIPDDHFQFASKHLKGKNITWTDSVDENKTSILDYPTVEWVERGALQDNFPPCARNPFEETSFRKLAAERSVVAEARDYSKKDVDAYGVGLTNLFCLILNSYEYESKLITSRVLSCVNEICAPDSEFLSIQTQVDNPQRYAQGRDEKEMWQIYLEDENGTLTPLSKMGTGFQTILLVVSLFVLLPETARQGDNRRTVYALEELENNLHPAMLRRLLHFIYEISVKSNNIIFITTHSGTIIDYFRRDVNADIYHVCKKGGHSTIAPVKTYVEHSGILDDLDIRASDLLQANSVVWVEGPSDRIYYKRFIEVYSGGQLVEGDHFQCVFYGGRLLAHLTGDVEGADSDQLLNILRVNRNSVLIFDSDRSNKHQSYDKTKRRIVDQLNASGMLAFNTHGREVENYIPLRVISCLNGGGGTVDFGWFDDFKQKFDAAGVPPRLTRDKVALAEAVGQQIRPDDIRNCEPLNDKIAKIVRFIRSANGLL